MNRRTLLHGLLSAGFWNTFWGWASAAPAPVKDMKDVEALRKNWKMFLAPGAKPPSPTQAFQLSDAEWRKRLTNTEYNVLRKEGTEAPGSSALNNEKRDGVFVCAGCELPLFTSAMKYESGTGWPSFFTAIPDAFATKPDRKLFVVRTEYHCKRCGGHHGHVFDDGPPPTRERWCNNGVALKFIPKA